MSNSKRCLSLFRDLLGFMFLHQAGLLDVHDSELKSREWHIKLKLFDSNFQRGENEITHYIMEKENIFSDVLCMLMV